MSAVGERIRSRRRELGLSQRELAEPGVSYAYISRIECGQRDPSVKALRKIAPKLGVSVHWLETGEEDPLEAYVREIGRLEEIERLYEEARLTLREREAMLDVWALQEGIPPGYPALYFASLCAAIREDAWRTPADESAKLLDV